jgi:hypothetical protein
VLVSPSPLSTKSNWNAKFIISCKVLGSNLQPAMKSQHLAINLIFTLIIFTNVKMLCCCSCCCCFEVCVITFFKQFVLFNLLSMMVEGMGIIIAIMFANFKRYTILCLKENTYDLIVLSLSRCFLFQKFVIH